LRDKGRGSMVARPKVSQDELIELMGGYKRRAT
jgi:hypothetical protein